MAGKHSNMSMHNRIIFAIVSAIGYLLTGTQAGFSQQVAAGIGRRTIGFRIAGDQYEGRLLHWTQEEIFLLKLDGSLARVDRTLAADFRVVSDRFVPLSMDAIRARLLHEFGREYTVDATTHYLVVRPVGKGEFWKDLFESTYRNVERFSAQRRLPTRNTSFPLVAIVLKTREDFLNYLGGVKTSGIEPAKTLGVYDPVSNRVVTFDVTSLDRTRGLEDGDRLRSVIRHEAFHQAAANTDLINRFADVPLWFNEGMALLFESEFINAPSKPQRAAFSGERNLKTQAKFILARQSSGWLRQLVLSDELFSRSPEAAYGLSWTLVRYLSERHHQAFVRYLIRINHLPPFESLAPEQRVADFVDTFGDRWEVLESSVRSYVDQM